MTKHEVPIDLGWCQGYMGLKYHMEEALAEKNMNTNLATHRPPKAIFAHAYCNDLDQFDHTKVHDYCFVGSIESDSSNRK